ncbi:MAG TPA: sulfite exporter TauE/SafE family protein [Streptosporangiaceae bacterium]
MAAGAAGGLTGSIAGLASLATYPALLALGIPPVTANITNTVALVAGSAGSVAGSRRELAGHTGELRALAVIAAAGGAVGSALLLILPQRYFELAVPLLLGAGSLLVLPRPPGRGGEGGPGGPEGGRARPPAAAGPRPALPVAVALICVYVGFFGAGGGILLLAVLLTCTGGVLARCNAAKNLLAGLANLVAACAFAVLGHPDWRAALPLAAGLLAGGAAGPSLVRIAPAGPLRAVVAVLGLAFAVYLGVRTYR